MVDSNLFVTAVKASGYTKKEARDIVGLNSYSAFEARLSDPGNFRLYELVLLKESMNETGQELLDKAIDDFLCPGD